MGPLPNSILPATMAVCRLVGGLGNWGSNDGIQWGVGNVITGVVELDIHSKTQQDLTSLGQVRLNFSLNCLSSELRSFFLCLSFFLFCENVIETSFL